MTSYLHLHAGHYDLLIDIARVREVLVLDDATVVGNGDSHRAWRDEILPVRDLTATLGGPPRRRPAAVVLDDGLGGHVFLEVDGIGRVMAMEDRQFQPLPPLTGPAEAAFDGFTMAGGLGRGMLRLRLDAVLAEARP